MKNLIVLMLLSFLCSGCSLLPRMTFSSPGVTPTNTEKGYNYVKCAKDLQLDEAGQVVSCAKGYVNKAQNYKQAERKFTLQERIGNFIRNLTGWGFWVLILLCVFTPFGGAIVGGILNNLYGIGSRGMKMLVKGIQDGKKYVRENGSKYSDSERVIYQQGATDMLQRISESLTDDKVRRQINLLRAYIK